MKHFKRTTPCWMVLLIGLFVFAGSAFAAEQTGTLTTGPATGPADGTVFDYPVAFTATADVGGVAFTLTFNKDELEFVGLTDGDVSVKDPTGFSDDPYTAGEATASDLFYQHTDAADANANGEVLIAAASATALSEGIIFNVQFKVVKADAAEGDVLSVDVAATELDNESAGYNTTNGTTVDVLGAMPDADGNFTNVFPALGTTLTGGDVTVGSTGPAEDVTGDGNINLLDLLAVIDLMGSPSPGAADVNGDGNANLLDLLAIIDKM
ncbi:dockerin type I domain-containing protein [Desulfonema magnum]|uniref:Cohesin and dockerin domain-containing protein n=1 Tax=Desulfonema magnum TaxID=45655 RepID=A0A975BWV5_9BACT|nr:dockerin type I domain-containing protein [Desulfonema magnum]QTA93244.1 Cohesin and dockerin domain-containing protein [Desulfonema magnum]